MPFVPRLKFCLRTEQIKWSSAIEGVDLHAFIDAFHSHLPIPRVSARMEVAIIHQSFQFQLDGLAPSYVRVLHISSVLTLVHPDPLFDQRIPKSESPDRSGAIQSETFDVHVALGFNSAAQPSVCGKRRVDAGIVNSLVQLCDKLSSTYRRVECSDQKAVIATRQIAADGSRRESADSIRDQPFPLFYDI